MIQFDSIVFEQDGAWHFNWDSSGDPTDIFDVYLNGFFVDTITGTSYSKSTTGNPDDDPPTLEVVPTGTIPECVLNPPIVSFQWYADPNVDSYLVERQIGADWVPVSQCSSFGNFLLYFVSGILEDDATVVFRIIALNKYYQQSNPIEVPFDVVCNPVLKMNGDRISVVYNNPNITVDFDEE